MDKVQKIITDIEHRIYELECGSKHSEVKELRYILSLVKTVQEIPVGDDLKEEIHKEVMKLRTVPCYDELELFAIHFANWQKEQMMKGAIELEVINDYANGGQYINIDSPFVYERMERLMTNKAKVIIIKE